MVSDVGEMRMQGFFFWCIFGVTSATTFYVEYCFETGIDVSDTIECEPNIWVRFHGAACVCVRQPNVARGNEPRTKCILWDEHPYTVITYIGWCRKGSPTVLGVCVCVWLWARSRRLLAYDFNNFRSYELVRWVSIFFFSFAWLVARTFHIFFIVFGDEYDDDDDEINVVRSHWKCRYTYNWKWIERTKNSCVM